MDVAVFAIILVALAAFVAAPLYRQPQGAEPTLPGETDSRAESVRAALRELEVDRASGLLTEAEYEEERSALERD
jgi:cytochrome c-type biogenesis protein CcmI